MNRFSFKALCLMAAAGPAAAQIRYTEISAKIVLEDGSSMSTSPLVVVDPGNNCVAEAFLGGTLKMKVPYLVTGGPTPACRLSVRLTGYRPFSGLVEDGTMIKLNRVGPHEDATVSKNNISAPADAKKRYEAGEAAAARKKWPQAEEQFRAAVTIYPAYAAAWSELGRALQQQDRLNEAVEALNQAREADPQYIKPVAQLAEIAGIQARWEDQMRLSQQVVTMHPVGFTTAYYTYAQAAFHMGSLGAAETLAREAIRQDRDAQCPESMVLLGAIFEKQGNAADALVEYKAYLKVAPRGPEAQHAKDAVARLR